MWCAPPSTGMFHAPHTALSGGQIKGDGTWHLHARARLVPPPSNAAVKSHSSYACACPQLVTSAYNEQPVGTWCTHTTVSLGRMAQPPIPAPTAMALTGPTAAEPTV